MIYNIKKTYSIDNATGMYSMYLPTQTGDRSERTRSHLS